MQSNICMQVRNIAEMSNFEMFIGFKYSRDLVIPALHLRIILGVLFRQEISLKCLMLNMCIGSKYFRGFAILALHLWTSLGLLLEVLCSWKYLPQKEISWRFYSNLWQCTPEGSKKGNSTINVLLVCLLVSETFYIEMCK